MGTTVVTQAGDGGIVSQDYQKTVIYGAGNSNQSAQEVKTLLHISGAKGLVVDAAGGALANGSTGAKNVIDAFGVLRSTVSTEVRLKGGARLGNQLTYPEDMTNGVWTKVNFAASDPSLNATFNDIDGSSITVALTKLTLTGGYSQHSLTYNKNFNGEWISAYIDINGLTTKLFTIIAPGGTTNRIDVLFTSAREATGTIYVGGEYILQVVGDYQCVIYMRPVYHQNKTSFAIFASAYGSYSGNGEYMYVSRAMLTQNIYGNIDPHSKYTSSNEYLPVYLSYKGIHIWGDSLVNAGSPLSVRNRLISIIGNVYDGGVGGESSVGILARFLADTNHQDRLQIICMGRNNYQNTAQVLADYAAAVAAIPHNGFVILAVPNGEYISEYLGGENHHYFTDLKAALLEAYPDNYLVLNGKDTREMLVDSYDPASPQDVLDFSHDIVPASCRYDNVHWNAKATAIVFNAIVQFIALKGMLNPVAVTNSAVLHEPATENLALFPRDLTNEAYVKTDCTAEKTAAGTDGVINSASTLTATAANATCLQTVTSASANRVTGAFVKRRTGTGVVEMTQDNGSTWTPVTVPASWSAEPLVIPAATLANPIFGFRIVTSGDAIDVDWVQHELGGYITSPISGSRTIDSIKIPLSANINFPQIKGICFGKLTMQFASSAGAKSLLCTSSAATDFIHDNGSGEIAINDGTNTATTSGLGGWAAGDVLLFAACWVTNAMSIHVSKNGGAWVNSANATYAGAFPAGANFLLCNANTDSILINAMKIKSTTKSLADAQTWAKNAAVYEAV